MSRYTLTVPVNAPQLDVELAAAHGWATPSGVTVRLPGQLDFAGAALPGVLIVCRDDDNAAKVAATVAAHIPDPMFGHPVEMTRLAAIRAKALTVQAGTATFTATEIQQIIAAAILRLTK